MTDSDPGRLGTLTDVSGARFIARIGDAGDDYSPYRQIGIERIAVNIGRAAGLPEDKLPEVIVSEERVSPTVNDAQLARRLKVAWEEAMGADALDEQPPEGMGAEDFPLFTVDPDIPSVYWGIGGTPQADLDAEEAGGPPVPSHHSPLFKIAPEPSVRAGVESTVVALLELMGD